MEQIQDFRILQDLRSNSLKEEIEYQFDFISEILDKLSESHKAIKDIRDIRKQLNNYTSLLPENENMQPIFDAAERIDSSLTVVEVGIISN